MTVPPPELLLPNRVKLPAEIAYLRDAYPAPDWHSHSNYGELTAFWLHVHASLREQGGNLQQMTGAMRERRVEASEFQRDFVPRFNHFLQHLNGHHQIEDHAYFPKFRMLDARLVSGFDLLEHDHELIHANLLATVESARKLLVALGQPTDVRRALDTYADTSGQLLALLTRHLADEEELVIPAILKFGERSVS